MTLKERFTRNPQTYYALSIAATWAGIGSLMNGVTMTQTYGAIPSLIWVIGNVLACILFGAVACKIPKVREVFRSRLMEYICAVMCVFQAWLSMNGMQTVFADTALGPNFGQRSDGRLRLDHRLPDGRGRHDCRAGPHRGRSE